MLCDHCKERDAVINLTQVEHDSKVTLHLCEQCAAEKGVETGVALLKSPLGGFITAMGKSAGSLLPATIDGAPCPNCGGTLRDFRETGRLGCAVCYGAFEVHLRDLLRRLHGSSQHVGERYEVPGADSADPARRLLDLRHQLRVAVDAENFELAAELRDRIRVLE
ncbi:MAG TPA: UvrB/UvrC motif-containing protein [Gemmatimonadales bacterium]|nr:UvrB/UvrC motif-containing protein [Gemmatimonadales bacterium]